MKNLLKALFILLVLVIISCSKKQQCTNTTFIHIDTIFRIKERIIHDTITNTEIVEKIVEKEIIKYVDRIVEKAVIQRDTIVKTNIDTIVKYETLYLEDSTKIVLLNSQIDSFIKANIILTNNNDSLSAKNKLLFWWLILFFILGVGITYYLYQQKIKRK